MGLRNAVSAFDDLLPKPAAAGSFTDLVPAKDTSKIDLAAPAGSEGFAGGVADVGRGLAHGIISGLPQQVGQALQFFGAPETGAKLQQFAKEQDAAHPELRQSIVGQREQADSTTGLSVRGGAYSGGENYPASVGPGLAGAAIGGAIGSVFPGPGTLAGAGLGYIAGSVAALPLFYGSQGQQSTEAIRKGLQTQVDSGAMTPEQADAQARTGGHVSGAIEAGGELAGDLIPFGALAKPFAKAVAGQAVKSMFSGSGKRALGTLGKTLLAESVTETGQQAAEAQVEKEFGSGGEGATVKDTLSVVVPTVIMSLVPGGFAAIHNVRTVGKARELLSDPKADPEDRAAAAALVFQHVKETDPTVAKAFDQYAGMQIAAGAPVELGDDQLYLDHAQETAADQAMGAPRAPLLQPPAQPIPETLRAQALSGGLPDQPSTAIDVKEIPSAEYADAAMPETPSNAIDVQEVPHTDVTAPQERLPFNGAINAGQGGETPDGSGRTQAIADAVYARRAKVEARLASLGLDPNAGGLSAAAVTAVTSGAANVAQTRTMPFSSEVAAQKRADAMARQTGQPHVAAPHPEVAGMFAALPQAQLDAQAATADAAKQADKAQQQQVSQAQKAGDKVRADEQSAAIAAGEAAVTPEPKKEGAPPEPAMPAAERKAHVAALDERIADTQAHADTLKASDHPDDQARVDALERHTDELKGMQDALKETPSATRNEGQSTAQVQRADTAQSTRPQAGEAARGAADQAAKQQGVANATDAAAHEAASSPQNAKPEPTPAQIDAGNYEKGHIKVGPLDISIENPEGSTRRSQPGVTPAWESKLAKAHYGYIRGTIGADKDHIDAFVKPGTPQDHDGPVYVIDQPGPEGFDEHKVMVGYPSKVEAIGAYKANYPKGHTVGPVTETTMREFDQWARGFETLKPFGETTAAVAETKPASRETTGAQNDYYGTPGLREIAHGVRNGDDQAIAAAAERMADRVSKGDVLVPMPGHTGRAIGTLKLAHAIAARVPGVKVADVLRGNARESHYEAKKAGRTLSADELAMRVEGAVPDNALILDTVHDTGATLEAARTALPQARSIALAEVVREKAAKPKKNAVAEAKAKREAEKPQQSMRDIARKRFLKVIRDAGGIDMAEVRDITGETAFNANKLSPGLFRKAGKPLDLIAERLHEVGYLTDAQYQDVDGAVQLVRDKVREALDGKPVYRMDELDAVAEKSLAEAVAEEHDVPVEAVQEMIADLAPDTTVEEAIAGFDAAAYLAQRGVVGDEAEAILERAALAADNGADYETAVKAAAESSGRSGEGVRESDDAPPLTLTTQSNDEVLAAEQAARERAAATAAAALAAEQRAQADRDIGSFALSGSNREADKAAAEGQQDLLAAPVEAAKPQTSAEYDAALDETRSSTREFQKAQDDYRAGRIGDAEFLAAKAKYEAQDNVFDAAHAQEAALSGIDSDIPLSTAVGAHSGTSFSPERRGASEVKEYAQTLRQDYANTVAKATTQEQRDELTAIFERYRAGYRQRYLSHLGSRSGIVSTMIAGGSNFPVRRMEKKNAAAHNKLTDLLEYRTKMLDVMRRALVPEHLRPIASGDANAVDKLKQKLAELEKLQETMKAANAAVRRKDDAALRALGFNDARIAQLKEKDFAGRIGFADYQLKNNSAEIRRVQARIAQVSASQAQASRELAFEGGKVVDSVDDNRLQIFFNAKPDEATRTKLKANGFKWAPSVGAWQRFRGPNAEGALERAIGVKFPGPRPMFNAGDELSPEPFYSALARSIETKAPFAKDGTVQPGQLRMWLAARSKDGSFKADELTWSGLDEWLQTQTGKVTKAQVQAFLDQNGVKVTEKLLGGSGTREANQPALIDEYQRWRETHDLPNESADELMHRDGLTDAQRAWLHGFSARWDADAAGESQADALKVALDSLGYDVQIDPEGYLSEVTNRKTLRSYFYSTDHDDFINDDGRPPCFALTSETVAPIVDQLRRATNTTIGTRTTLRGARNTAPTPSPAARTTASCC
jgi:predicted amidophosphoribosyltransferase